MRRLGRILRSEILYVILLTLAAMVVRARLGTLDGGPTLFFDEDYYINNARAIFELRPYAQAHFPPLYSLVIAPGLIFRNWFPAVMAIGGIVSSLTIPAAWFLAKSVGVRRPIWVAAIVAVLPAYFAYSQFMMSENLSTPLFVVALALAVRGRSREGWLLGLSTVALVLTKYLFLPAAAVFFAVYIVRWVQNHRREHSGATRSETARSIVPVLIGVAVPIVVLFGAWLAYGLASGDSLFELAGLEVPTATVKEASVSGTPALLLLWIGIYLGMLLLPWLPAWFSVVVATGSRAVRRAVAADRAAWVFGIAVIVLATGYVLIAAQHSLGSDYNYPHISRAWGRYLMHLGPPLVVLGLLALQYLLAPDLRLSRLAVAVEALALVALAVAGWFVLIGGRVFHLPASSFTNPLTAADFFPLRWAPVLIAIVALVVAVAIVLLVPTLRKVGTPLVAAAWLVLTLAMTATWVITSVPRDPYANEDSNFNGTLGRKIFEQESTERTSPGQKFLYIEADGLDVSNVRSTESFWGVSASTIGISTLSSLGITIGPDDRTSSGVPALQADIVRAAQCDDQTTCVLVTRDPLALTADTVDARFGQTLWFYRLN